MNKNLFFSAKLKFYVEYYNLHQYNILIKLIIKIIRTQKLHYLSFENI